MFREADEGVTEKAFVRLSYSQAAFDYLAGSYPVPFEEAARLAALQAGAEGCVGGAGGDEGGEEGGERGGEGGAAAAAAAEGAAPAFAAALVLGDRAAAADALDAFVPRSVAEASGASRRQWRREIVSAARELLVSSPPPPPPTPTSSSSAATTAAAAAVVSPDAARSLFQSRLRSLPYGGCLFFPVRRVQDPVGLLPPGRLSLGVNARGLHFFRGGGGGGCGGAAGSGSDEIGGNGKNDDHHRHHHLYPSSSSSSSSSAAREYLYSAELRDIIQFGSSVSSVFFKMRVAGVLHVFQFRRRGKGTQSASLCRRTSTM